MTKKLLKKTKFKFENIYKKQEICYLKYCYKKQKHNTIFIIFIQKKITKK